MEEALTAADINNSDTPISVTEKWYDIICSAIKSAAEKTIPRIKRSNCPQRGVSASTRDIFDHREKMSKDTHSKQQYRDIQRRIKESCLQDFKDWV